MHVHSHINITYVCDQICKKVSYMHATSTFHNHTVDTSSEYPCVHVLWQTIHQYGFAEAAF